MRRFHSIKAAISGLLVLMAASQLCAQAPPEWTVNPSEFEHFMTVTAELTIDGEVAADTNTVVAAFIDGECQGVADPSVVEGEVLYFLMIYGNTNNSDVSFRTFYAPEDTILALTDSLIFESGEAFGSPGEPHTLHGSTGISAIDSDYPGVIQSMNLEQNFPNPFNPSTTIRYHLSHATPINLSIYDLRGNRVCILVNKPMSPGGHTVHWDGRNAAGESVSAGVYLYRIVTPGFTQTRKMQLVK